MKLFITLAFTVLTIFSSIAQDKVGDVIPLTEFPESKTLMANAKEYTSAIVSKEFTKVANLTHPDIIKLGGGADFLIADLKSESNGLDDQGLFYISAELGNHPEFLNSQGELQTIIPVKYYLSLQDDKVESWVNLFAVSKDKGKSWTFVNLEKFDETSLREFVKNVSQELVYP